MERQKMTGLKRTESLGERGGRDLVRMRWKLGGSKIGTK